MPFRDSDFWPYKSRQRGRIEGMYEGGGVSVWGGCGHATRKDTNFIASSATEANHIGLHTYVTYVPLVPKLAPCNFKSQGVVSPSLRGSSITGNDYY